MKPTRKNNKPKKRAKAVRLCQPAKLDTLNGMGDLATRAIAALKGRDYPGQFYLHPAGTRDCGEEWSYFVTGKVGDAEPTVRINDGDKDVFEGPASRALYWCEHQAIVEE